LSLALATAAVGCGSGEDVARVAPADSSAPPDQPGPTGKTKPRVKSTGEAPLAKPSAVP